MRRRVLSTVAFLVCLAPHAAGQTAKTPTVSARQFTGGSATVSVTGVVEIAAEVPLNTQASVADGSMTWLQYGASGSETPNALITYSPYEVGVSVGKGKFIVTAGIMEGEKPQCSGSSEVTGSRDYRPLHLPGADVLRRRHREDGHGGHRGPVYCQVVAGDSSTVSNEWSDHPRFRTPWSYRHPVTRSASIGDANA